MLALWSALAEGRAPEKLEDGSGIATQLAALMSRIEDARYTAFVVEPAALQEPHAALLIEALHRIVKAINRTHRAGVLTLGGAPRADHVSAKKVIVWVGNLSAAPIAVLVDSRLVED